MRPFRLGFTALVLWLGGTLPAQGVAVQPSPLKGFAGQDLLVRAWKAQNQVAYRGFRLYFFDFGQGKRLQEERVAVRPNGKGGVDFRLDLTAILDSKGRNGGVINLTLAQALFSLREGSNFRYRGFHIHNLDLALRNYDVILQGNDVVASRPCRVIFVAPKAKDRRAWKVWLDGETGLVLKYLEISPEGKTVAGMEMEAQSFQIGKNVAFQDIRKWWRPSGASHVFKTLGEAEQAFGAPALVPSYLPPGYMLMEVRVARDTWKHSFLVLKYTDGIDTFSVIEGLPAPGAVGKGPFSPGGQNPPPPVIHRYRLGCLTQLWTTVEGRMIMMVGRMSPDEVPLVFQTLL